LLFNSNMNCETVNNVCRLAWRHYQYGTLKSNTVFLTKICLGHNWLDENSSTEINGYLRDINVIIIVILTSHNNIYVTTVWRDFHFGNIPCQIYNFFVHPLFVPRKHAIEKQATSTRNTISIQTFFLQPIKKLPESRIVFYNPSVPNSPTQILMLDDPCWNSITIEPVL